MNDENFLLEYEKLLDKGYCDCNEMNCIDNDSPRRILRIAKNLQQENKELKKQYEEYIRAEMKLKDELEKQRKEYQETYKDVREEIKEYKNQQKEFIEYLEEPIKIIIEGNPTNISEYTAGKLDALKEILSKYKEIIGVKDE